MLATIGFVVVGLFFAVFGVSFELLVVRKTKLHLTEFAIANGLMALAFWLLATITYLSAIGPLQVGVIVVDGIIIAATVAVADVFLAMVRYREVWLVVSVIASFYLLSDRVSSYPPVPYVHNGLLVMNDQLPVTLSLVALALLVWLPVCILMTREITHEIGQTAHWIWYAVLYIASFVLALTFALSGRMELMVGAFAGLVVCFALLLAANLHVAKDARTHHRRNPQAPAHHAQ